MEFTDITVLVDRSGSMESIQAAMESAYAEFLRQHRTVPTTRVTLIQFDSQNAQEVVYTAKPVAEADPLVIQPRAMTPLLDALGRAIDSTGIRFKAMPEPDRPDQVLFVIITDGLENASVVFDRATIKARIEQQQTVYKWQFVYLGANQNAIAEAASLGIVKDAALDYDAVPDAAYAGAAAAAYNTVQYANRTEKAVGAFSNAQRASAKKTPVK